MGGKFCISVDLEGVACVSGSGGKGLSCESVSYSFAAKQATREADAAARALFDCGACEVIIWDSHGTGVNLDYDAFDKRCKFAIGAGSRIRFPGVDSSFDGVLFIGYHAYDTEKATLSHVFSSSANASHLINGEPVGELQFDAAIAGKRGVKTLFVASDDICISQSIKSFPWAKTVVTKESLAWNSCLSRHPAAVVEEIYKKVCEAVAQIDSMKEYKIKEPFELTVSYKHIDIAQRCNLHSIDNKPFEIVDAYTRKGVLADIEDYFLY